MQQLGRDAQPWAVHARAGAPHPRDAGDGARLPPDAARSGGGDQRGASGPGCTSRRSRTPSSARRSRSPGCWPESTSSEAREQLSRRLSDGSATQLPRARPAIPRRDDALGIWRRSWCCRSGAAGRRCSDLPETSGGRAPILSHDYGSVTSISV
jgi:hypothetical protein